MSSYPEILLTLRRFIGNLTNFSSPFVGSHLDKGDKLIGPPDHLNLIAPQA
jgi:hypothetical protein